MDKSRILFGIITVMVIILTAIIHYQYLMVQKEKSILEQNLDKLTLEKENLNAELEQGKIDLHNKTEELNKVLGDMTSLEKEVEEIRAKLTEAEADLDKSKAEVTNCQAQKNQLNTELNCLRKDYSELKTRFDTVNQEITTLEENLRSKTFLKEALRKLKIEESLAKIQSQKIKQPYSKTYFDVKYGNRGFIIKDRKPTYPRNIKVEVLPAE